MRGSEQGFTKEAFNRLVVGKPQTLILIQTKLDIVFGAFTSIPWEDSEDNYYIADYTSFLFSVTK